MGLTRENNQRQGGLRFFYSGGWTTMAERKGEEKKKKKNRSLTLDPWVNVKDSVVSKVQSFGKAITNPFWQPHPVRFCQFSSPFPALTSGIQQTKTVKRNLLRRPRSPGEAPRERVRVSSLKLFDPRISESGSAEPAKSSNSGENNSDIPF